MPNNRFVEEFISHSTKKDGYQLFESLRNQFRTTSEIDEEDLLELAESTIRNLSRIRDDQILDILHFLLSFRVQMNDKDFRSFSQTIERIARHLSPKISGNGDKVRNPFIEHESTERELRNRIYREALRVGQVGVANVFA